jgi:hypothetical protein
MRGRALFGRVAFGRVLLRRAAGGRGRWAGARRGVTLVDVTALAIITLCVSAVAIVGCQQAYTPGRQNTCRNNMRQLSLALFQHAMTTTQGKLPGYINALERDDGYAYHDPRTGRTEPVSWVVMILPELDRVALYAEWKSGESPRENVRIGSPDLGKTRIYLEMLVCPSEPPPNRKGTPLSYAVNAGIPDFPEAGEGGIGGVPPHVRGAVCACPACRGKADAKDDGAALRPARDIAANGMFFDEFTTGRHFDPAARTRSVGSTLEGIVDPKDKTILLTENVDAVDYTLDPNPNAPNDEIYPLAERRVAVTWAPTSTFAADGAGPAMNPPRDSMRPNVAPGTGNGMSYDQARPSSHHPDGFNVAFVGSQVQYMKNSISYYVYARLMASDDRNAGLVDEHGTIAAMSAGFSDTPLTDAQVNP